MIFVAEVVGPASTGMTAEITAEPMVGWAATPVVGMGVVADKEVGSLLFVIGLGGKPGSWWKDFINALVVC